MGVVAMHPALCVRPFLRGPLKASLYSSFGLSSFSGETSRWLWYPKPRYFQAFGFNRERNHHLTYLTKHTAQQTTRLGYRFAPFSSRRMIRNSALFVPREHLLQTRSRLSTM